MLTTIERRMLILEILSDRRYETREKLSKELSVSKRTIERDIEMLSCFAPIYTTRGNQGGIHVQNGWYISRRYLNSEQEALLRELFSRFTGDEKRIIQSILLSFAKPKAKG